MRMHRGQFWLLVAMAIVPLISACTLGRELSPVKTIGIEASMHMPEKSELFYIENRGAALYGKANRSERVTYLLAYHSPPNQEPPAKHSKEDSELSITQLALKIAGQFGAKDMDVGFVEIDGAELAMRFDMDRCELGKTDDGEVSMVIAISGGNTFFALVAYNPIFLERAFAHQVLSTIELPSTAVSLANVPPVHGKRYSSLVAVVKR